MMTDTMTKKWNDEVGTSPVKERKAETKEKRWLLIVEDNELSREMMTDLLSGSYHILTAANGAEGIKLLKKHYRQLSAILLDIQMPVMDGYEFLARVSDNALISQVPVIIVTDSWQINVEQRCLKLGAVDFIRKPYNPELALARIRNIIRLRESVVNLSVKEFDELTGIYNKQAFLHHAEQMLEDNPDGQYVLIGIDIDNYKLTNSQYGEKKCDEFLQYFGNSLRKAVTDGVVGRFGGDQFILMLPFVGEFRAGYLEEAVRSIIKDAPIPHQIAKMGIYYLIDRNVPLATCCDHSFLPIKQIKGIYGQDVAFYTDEMRNQIMQQQRIQDCMEEALEQGQFVVYYQPKHDCMSRRIAGAEALVRWIHPEYGFMSPGQFIPLFERNGFITKLDTYVLERVCIDMKRWEKNGITPVPVSINISRRDFFENGWIEKRLEMIEKLQIDPRYLHMEVTESLCTENPEHIIECVQMVRGRGYLVEMDDFGSGYSSLGMLADFPLDVIKLDISFVRRLDKNEIVVETLIKLAHRMGFKVVAEGVENERQFKKLEEFGCDYIQGYYFSKPLSVTDFENYLYEDSRAKPYRADGAKASHPQWNDLTNELEIKNTLLECVNTLSTNEADSKKINRLLSIIARFYGGDRAYIFEFDDRHQFVSNTYEWCRDGVAPEIDNLQALDIHLVDGWINAFRRKDEFFLPSVSEIRDSKPELYAVLAPQQVESLMTAPLRANGEIVGFVGVDNPTIHTDTLVLMKSVTSFIINDLERSRNVRKLEEMSYKDSLTGLKNRRAYYRDIEQMEANAVSKDKPIGVVYVDINGLKLRNDQGGHIAGDKLILEIAEILKEHFGEQDIYRIGGDEFVVLITGISEEALNILTDSLKAKWTEEVTASVGAIWFADCCRIEKAVAQADKKMYEQKKQLYSQKMYDRRHRE